MTTDNIEREEKLNLSSLLYALIHFGIGVWGIWLFSQTWRIAVVRDDGGTFRGIYSEIGWRFLGKADSAPFAIPLFVKGFVFGALLQIVCLVVLAIRVSHGQRRVRPYDWVGVALSAFLFTGALHTTYVVAESEREHWQPLSNELLVRSQSDNLSNLDVIILKLHGYSSLEARAAAAFNAILFRDPFWTLRTWLFAAFALQASRLVLNQARPEPT